MIDLEEQKRLTDSLDLASRRYYNGENTGMTDAEFDIFLKKLQNMERESGVIYPNSPTIRVGSDIQDGFKKGTHPKPMYTIENVYDNEGLEGWLKKINEDYGVEKVNISVKYDGISCELHYVDGVFVQALTRGDKLVGDDITENVKTIRTIPMVLDGDKYYNHDFFVRGEILLPKSTLKELNDIRVQNGETPFSNTRNACSGSIKQLDPRVTAQRRLVFRAWDCFGDIEIGDMDTKTGILVKCGFYYELGTEPFSQSISCEGCVDDVMEAVTNFKTSLDNVIKPDYDYDGIVIKIDDVSIQDKIGTKDTRAIDWAIARKWNEDYVVETELVGVDWQVGRTGVLTPVGRLLAVECGGVSISNVTLNNVGFIESFNLHIGDILKITRSGGVIPYVLSARRGNINGGVVKIPQRCPDCGADLVMEGALLKCTNTECPSVVVGKIIQFCSKDCMDIRSIGDAVAYDLYKKKLVTNIGDLYKLKDYNIASLVETLGEGYGPLKVGKILNEIEKSKSQPWSRVLAGLSIPGVGKVIARTLANKYSYSALQTVTEEELTKIDGIGSVMAHDIYAWWHDVANQSMINELLNSGLSLKGGPVVHLTTDREEKVMDGLTVCFTGSSQRFKGDAIEEYLESLGATCTHGVSKKLDYLIVGEKPGQSKVNKANELGIKIIKEDEFFGKYGK